MSVTHDYHLHSNYSDGTVLYQMVAAAADAGLEGVGVADHCNVSDRDELLRAKREYGMNLDETHPLRREGIEGLRERFDLRVFDAVELDYAPRDEDLVAAFLDEAGFDYAIGSVHRVEGTNIQSTSPFADMSERERSAFVDDYYERLVELVDSELFEIAAHVDLVERTPPLRGYTTADHHEMVADAFARSRTVPELNAGRVLRDYGQFHPAPDFWAALRERGFEFVAGTDAHDPGEIQKRTAELDAYFEARDAEPVRLFEA
ncbi:histidinol-phosphatase [Halobacteriales archaeon QS_1_67_19]|nr:MAG: histidinol-phosphatase [Halobacteriales archaeon QS_1_67_19]